MVSRGMDLSVFSGSRTCPGAAVGTWARALADRGPRVDRHRERAARLAESGDPLKYIREIFGYKLTKDNERQIQFILENRRALIRGGNGGGKTFVATAMAGGWFFDALGSLPGENKRYRGCILLFPSVTHATSLDAAYRQIIEHARHAREFSGHVFPGFPESDEVKNTHVSYFGRVYWEVPNCPGWYMKSISPRLPARNADDQVAHAAGGRHEENLIALIEEAKDLAPAAMAAVDGWMVGSDNRAIALTNPTYSSGSLFVQRDLWAEMQVNTIKHDNVILRKNVIRGGAVSHVAIEEKLRNPLQVTCMGKYTEIQPNADHHDFVYALPDRDLADKEGPRDDGFPGHPDADLSVFRPSNAFCGQVLGLWPKFSSSRPFHDSILDNCLVGFEEPFDRGQNKKIPPAAVGVDAARWGDDKIIAMPRWGPTARKSVENYLASKKSETIIGSARVVPKASEDGDEVAGDKVASWLVSEFGKDSEYRVDQGGGGYIYDGLKRLGCRVMIIPFGAKPAMKKPVSGQSSPLNRRAEMYLDLAAAMRLESARCMISSILREDLAAQKTEIVEHSSFGKKKDKVAMVKLIDKDIIKQRLGRSPDHSDAVVLASAETGIRGKSESYTPGRLQ